MTDYQGTFHYENQTLRFFATAEGYVDIRARMSEVLRVNYVYNYTDHLGNIRLSYANNIVNGITILEENHYYPFGLKHKKYGSVDKDIVCVDEDCYEVGIDVVPPMAKKTYQYKYNGKEFQDELGLNFYDYGARNYDPAIGRWINVDPLAEQFPSHSPYEYCFSNPLRYVDPDGRAPEDIIIRLLAVNGFIKDTKYQPYLIIKSDRYHRTVDVPFIHPNTIGKSTDVLPPQVIDNRILGQYALDFYHDLFQPDATSFSLSGQLAYKLGAQVSYSAAVFHKGQDTGKWGQYFTLDGLVGLGLGVSVDVGFINSKTPISDFNRETLAGWGRGVQASRGVGVSYFEGFDVEYSPSLYDNKGNFSPSLFTETTLYTGKSISLPIPGTGVKDLKGGASGFLGWTERVD